MRYLLLTLLLIPGLLNAQQPIEINTAEFIQEMVNEVNTDSIKSYVAKMVSFGTRHTLSETESDQTGIGAARRWVTQKFGNFSKRSNGRMEASLDAFMVPAGRRIPYEAELKNAMAVLKGTGNDERILIVSGHLDSRVSDVMDSVSTAPGANDDASGVALVIELARVMSTREFPATIIFVAVSGEEQGLLGATHLADKLKADNSNVIAMFNNDMVGNTAASEIDLNDASRMRIFSETIPAVETEEMQRLREYTGGENDSRSRQLARFIKAHGEAYVPGFTVVLNYRVDRYLRGGDHIPFTRNGFTAVRLCEMNENYLHQHQDLRVEEGVQYGDLPEYVNYEYITKVARVNLSSLATLAMSPAIPQNVGIRLTLGNVSSLEWDAPASGPAPEGYYVLIRETYESTWSREVYVEGTEVSLPLSKDNYFFAVQAVSEGGYRSLPVTPAPKR